MIALGFAECENTRASQHEEGRRLLCEMLKDLCDIHTPEILKEQNGKPYCKGAAFSVSHSKNIAACAVITNKKSEGYLTLDIDANEIGFDIEVAFDDTQRYKKIAARYFLKEENEYLENSDNYSSEFLKLWTKKESYIKYTGEGLAAIRTPLPSDIITDKINIFKTEVIYSIYAK